MHAVRLHTFGPAENLTYETTDDPVPGPGQVRIAVAAAGVHLLDTALREGMTGPFPAPAELPTVPGRRSRRHGRHARRVHRPRTGSASASSPISARPPAVTPNSPSPTPTGSTGSRPPSTKPKPSP